MNETVAGKTTGTYKKMVQLTVHRAWGNCWHNCISALRTSWQSSTGSIWACWVMCRLAWRGRTDCEWWGNWKQNNVFEAAKDEDQKCIPTRWMGTLKETPDGLVPKARVVARGFEEMNTEELTYVSVGVSLTRSWLLFVKRNGSWTPWTLKQPFCKVKS